MKRFGLLLLTLLFSIALLQADTQPKEEPDNPTPEPEAPLVEGTLRLALDPGGETGKITGAVFSPDGQQLITASDIGIRIRDAKTGEVLRLLRAPGAGNVRALALSPDGQKLAVAGSYSEKGKVTPLVYLLTLADGRVERQLKGHTGPINAVAFSPDGQQLASSDEDSTVRVWSLTRDEPPQVTKLVRPGSKGKPPKKNDIPRMQTLVFSPDGKRLASSVRSQPKGGAAFDMAVMTWPPNKKELEVHFGLQEMVAWSPDGKHLATCARDGVLVCDATGKVLRTVLHKEVAVAVSFSADSRQLLAVMHGKDKQNASRAVLLDVASGKQEKSFPLAPRLVDGVPGGWWEHTALRLDGRTPPLRIVFSPKGDLAVTIADGNTGAQEGGGPWARGFVLPRLDIWKTEDGSVLRRLEVSPWISPMFEPNRHSLWPSPYTASWSKDSQVAAWVVDGSPAAKKKLTAFDLANLRLVPTPANRGFVRKLKDADLELKSPKPTDTPTEVLKNGKRLTLLTPPKPFRWSEPHTTATLLGQDRALLTGQNGFTFEAWLFDVNAGTLLQRLRHRSCITSLAASPDGRFLMTLAQDQILRVWSLDKASLLASLFVSGKEWIVWTEEGYYASSPGGEKLMGWIVDNGPDEPSTFHPASRFRARLYRPDVIALLLKEGSVDKALKSADEVRGQVSKPVVISQVLPPKVSMTSSARAGSAFKGGKVKIDAEAAPVGADPLTELQLLIDDRPYTGDKGVLTLDKPQKGPVKATWEVQLPPGAHNIRVLARTGASLGTSRGMELAADNEKPEPKKEPSLYLLAVGIDGYADKGLTLTGAVNDAKELEKVFQQYSSPLFPKINPKVLVDRDATRKGILEGLDWLKEKMTPADLAVFFYAGHGDVNKGEFYLLPQDVTVKDLPGTGLSRAELKKRMQGIPGKVLVVLDACHSGAVGLLFDDVSRELTDEDCGVIVMCAATPKQVALEKDGHGHLTRSMIEGLSGKAGKRDGSVFLSHLRAYIEDRVIELSKDKQHPVVVVPPWMRPFGLSKP